MTENKGIRYDLKEINRDVFSMIVPISVEGVLQMVVSTVLMAMIGRIDVLAVNAIGIGTRITQLLWAFAKGIAVGVTVMVAKDLGAGHKQNLRINAVNGLASLFAVTAVCSLGIYTFAPQIVHAFGGSAETMAQSILYMRIISVGIPFWSILLTTSGILQGLGDAKTPMFLTSAYNILSIAIGYVLIFGNFGFPSMGIAGAGWALVIAQLIMAVISFTTLVKKGIFKAETVEGYSRQVQFMALKGLYIVGLPAAFENMLWQLGAIAMMKPIIGYGDYAYAAHQMSMQAESISYMPTMGFGIAATSLIGRCFGANNYDKAKVYFAQIKKLLLYVTATIMFVMIVFAKPLMGILTQSPEIINLGAWYLVIAAVTLIPQNLYGVYCGAMRGAGYTKLPMYLAFTGLWLIRVPLSFISAYFIAGSTIHFVWIAMGIDLITRYFLSRYTMQKKDIFKDQSLPMEG